MKPTQFQRPDHLHHEAFPVVTTLFNSARYRTRWKHYEDFAPRVEQAGGILYTVEVALGDRAFVLTPGPRVIQLRTNSEMWIKENAINIGVQFLTAEMPNWTKVAWIDADVRFVRDDWADEAKHHLERYEVIQMWSHILDVTADYKPDKILKSFMQVYSENPNRAPQQKYYHKSVGAPGLAWACTRHAWDTFGGLHDVGILGSSDSVMAYGLVGEVNLDERFHPEYRLAAERWQERALVLRKDVGVMSGTAIHFWHGSKIERKYTERWKILWETQFDPTRHIARNAAGLYEFTPFAPIELRDRVRAYMSERNEDA